jgi:class 3 adenylate cyclase/tetratricopeptide (TPR) repeat protein
MICTNCRTDNPDTSKFCANCGTQLSPAPRQVGERKLVTVLFADVVGSTAMGERVDPEDITDIMNGAFAIMNDAVARHKGMVARLMGDAILAFFGAQIARENDAERAVLAGLEICKSAAEYAQTIRKRFGVDFQVRVGINTGLAVMDIVGNQVRSEFTAMGDAVNLTSRLQNAASPGSILISHDTYRHVRGLFLVQPLEPIHAKGISEPVQVYQVLGARERAFHQPTRGVAGIETPMVGRERELLQLKEVFNALKEPGPAKARIVTITGEAGVGKSRLLYEFTNWLDLQAEDLRLFRARATEEMAHLPYSLLRELFTREFDIHDSDSEAVAKHKLEEGISAILPAAQADLTPIIGYLIGFNYANSPLLQGILDDGKQIRERALNAAGQIFKTLLQDHPVLVLLEDIHWADEGSLDFIEHLAVDCLGYPLMLVCLARKSLFERRPSWGDVLSSPVQIDLSQLSDRDSQRLVVEILRNVAEIPPGLYDLIVRRADGNPFYVEEAVKMLIDDGAIVPGAERWQVRQDKLIEGKIPPTLTGLLQARLDGLPSHERRILHRSSVAGRVFWDELTSKMVEANGEQSEQRLEIAGALANLQGRELIHQVEQSTFSGTNEYIFKHALLREVTYEGLLKRLRRIYHLQVAEWLCERSGEQVGVYAGRIGEHFEYADEALRAAEWYARAGKQSQDTYVPEMAKDYYQRALRNWEKAEALDLEQQLQQIQVFHGLGQVLHWLGLYDEAIETFQKMAQAALKLGDGRQQARAWQGTAEAQMHRGDVKAAIQSASQAEAKAGESGAELELIKALWMKAWGAFRLGEMEKALSLAQRVSELSHQLEDQGQMAHSLNLLGVLESVSGRFNESAVYFEQALEIFNTLGNRRRAMPLMNNLGVILEARGDYPGALARYQAALDTAREIGNRDGEMVYLSNLGSVQVRLGEYTEAEANLRQVIEMAGTSGLDVLSSTHSFLAKACLGQGKTGEALEAAQRALSLAEETGSQDDLGVAWRALGRVASAAGEPIQIRIGGQDIPQTFTAAASFEESERIFIEIEREDERARTLRERAKHELGQGNQEQGQRLWEEARQIFTQLGALAEVERMEEYYANQIIPLEVNKRDPGSGLHPGHDGAGR